MHISGNCSIKFNNLTRKKIKCSNLNMGAPFLKQGYFHNILTLKDLNLIMKNTIDKKKKQQKEGKETVIV